MPAMVTTICTVPDTQQRLLLASAGENGQVRLWNAEAGTEITTPMTGHVGWVWDMAPSQRLRELF